MYRVPDATPPNSSSHTRSAALDVPSTLAAPSAERAHYEMFDSTTVADL